MSAPRPGASDPDLGVHDGRPVARRFVSPDGLTVLVGRTAADNDVLTLALAAPADFWLHVAGGAGSHVVVRNPEGLDALPRSTLHFAAALAVRYSKARHGGRAAVHVARRAAVHKERRAPDGQVTLGRHRTVYSHG